MRKYIPIRLLPDLATSISLGYVRALSGGRIPLDRRLFLGGDKSVRGFGIDQIGFPDGGAFAFSSQNEIRIKLSFLGLAGFVDVGGVSDTAAALAFSDIRVGFGGGLRVMSPIGLIRGDIGFHWNKQGETKELFFDRTSVHLGLGQAF